MPSVIFGFGSLAWYITSNSAVAGNNSVVENISAAAMSGDLSVTFTPTLTIDSTKNPVMTDNAGSYKYYAGNTLVTPETQPALTAKYGTGTIKVDTNAAAGDGITIGQVYASLDQAAKYVKVTISSNDPRVKLFKAAPSLGGTGFQGAATVDYYSQVVIGSLENTVAIAVADVFWGYDGVGDNDQKDLARVTNLTFTAEVTFSATNS